MNELTRRIILSCRISTEYISIRNWGAKPTGPIVDPEVIKQREERKRKKLAREISLLKRTSKKPRPIDELKLTIDQVRTLDQRHRPPTSISDKVLVERQRAIKAFEKYQVELNAKDNDFFRNAMKAQERTLNVLKNLSPTLYQAAIQPESNFQLVINGPLLSPPIKDYEAPNGDYVDTTRKFEPAQQIDDQKTLSILNIAEGLLSRRPRMDPRELKKEARKAKWQEKVNERYLAFKENRKRLKKEKQAKKAAALLQAEHEKKAA